MKEINKIPNEAAEGSKEDGTSFYYLVSTRKEDLYSCETEKCHSEILHAAQTPSFLKGNGNQIAIRHFKSNALSQKTIR
jgi:hypothetical protein